MKETKLLTDVVIVRCILVMMIVLLHSFTMFQGAWPPTHGFKSNIIYEWIARIANSFTLPMFFLISGYVYSHQNTNKQITDNLVFIKKKIMRLVIPYLFFGIIYYFLFFYTKSDFHIYHLMLNLSFGVGHLWFLPVLFWIFLFVELIRKINFKINSIGMIFLFILSLNSLIIPNIFVLNKAFYYLFYFVLGMIVYNNKTKIKVFYNTKFSILGTVLFFLLFFVFSTYLIKFVLAKQSIDQQSFIVNKFVKELLIYVYSIAGCFMLLSLVWKSPIVDNPSMSNWIISLNSYSFGIYIFQEFILKYLYYKTNFIIDIGAKFFPWIGFALAYSISIILSKILIRTRIGKILIG